jgi:hypothetical protein
MPLYFGLPLTCEESFRLFNLNFEETKQNIMKKNNLTENNYMDCYFIDYLNKFFIDLEMKMRVFYTDKGQCIIGYEIKEVSNFSKKFLNVDQLMVLLGELKELFTVETEKFWMGFEEVLLEHMEDEPEIISFPVPYVIEYSS